MEFTTSTALIISGSIQLQVEGQYVKPPKSGDGYVTVINDRNRDLNITFGKRKFDASKYSIMNAARQIFSINELKQEDFISRIKDEIKDTIRVNVTKDMKWKTKEKVIVLSPNKVHIIFDQEFGHPKEYKARLSIVCVNTDLQQHIFIKYLEAAGAPNVLLKFDDHSKAKVESAPGNYQIRIKNGGSKDVNFKEVLRNGGVYTLVVDKDGDEITHHLYTNTRRFSTSIFWQVPQYIVITAAEILVSITGLSFAYSQAPASMKSIVQAGFLLTIAGGDFIDFLFFIIGGTKGIFPQNSDDHFFFAGLMLVVFFVYLFIARKYTYVEDVEEATKALLPKPKGSEPDDLRRKERSGTEMGNFN
jgi:hypothetical protein